MAMLVAASVAAPDDRSALQQLPPRDVQRPVETGTGSIRGHVVDAHTGEPLPGAMVQAIATGAMAGPPSAAATDADGRFEVTNLAPGNYLLDVRRAAYISTRYGQRGPNTRGTPIEVSNAHAVEKIVVRLERGGVITGRVFDPFGFPAVGVRVQALQYRYQNGQRQLVPAMTSGGFMGGTDDLGSFRIWGLDPGQYYVWAIPERPMVSPEVLRAPEGPVRTYFPSSADPGGAERVTVVAGRETGGVNIALVSGRLAKLSGRAVMSTGDPFTGATIMIVRQESGGISSTGGGIVRSDGTFEVPGVPPGQYTLVVRPMNAPDDGTGESARVRITVVGEDIDNIFLVGRLGATLRGVITTDEGVPPAQPASQFMVSIAQPPEERGTFVRPPVVKSDYTFEMANIFGRGRIDANLRFVPGAPPNSGIDLWAVKAVYWRGEDITGSEIDFDATQTVDGVEIVFSRRWAELSGVVSDERGQPVADASFLIFSSDESKWTQQARGVRMMRTAADGTFRMPGLPQGEYLLAVTGPVEPGRWLDPDFLRPLAERATRVTVFEGEKKTVNVRISTAP